MNRTESLIGSARIQASLRDHRLRGAMLRLRFIEQPGVSGGLVLDAATATVRYDAQAVEALHVSGLTTWLTEKLLPMYAKLEAAKIRPWRI